MHEVDAERRRQRLDHLDEAAGDECHGEAEALHGPDQRAGARGQRHRGPDLGEHRLRQAGQRGDPLVQARREVQLAAHGPLGDGRHLVGPPGVRREQLDDLVLDQGRVDVHDDQPAAAPSQTGGGDRDVDPAGRGLQGQLAAQAVDVVAPETSSSRVLTG